MSCFTLVLFCLNGTFLVFLCTALFFSFEKHRERIEEKALSPTSKSRCFTPRGRIGGEKKRGFLSSYFPVSRAPSSRPSAFTRKRRARIRIRPSCKDEDCRVVHVDVLRHLRLPLRLPGSIHPRCGDPPRSTTALRSQDRAGSMDGGGWSRRATSSSWSSTSSRLPRLPGSAANLSATASRSSSAAVRGRPSPRSTAPGFCLSQLRPDDGLAQAIHGCLSKRNGPLLDRQIRSR